MYFSSSMLSNNPSFSVYLMFGGHAHNGPHLFHGTISAYDAASSFIAKTIFAGYTPSAHIQLCGTPRVYSFALYKNAFYPHYHGRLYIC